jgi:DNA adenine methylase
MLSVKRSISQNGAKRQPVDEILAYFPPAKVVPKRNTHKKK